MVKELSLKADGHTFCQEISHFYGLQNAYRC